MLNVCLNNIDSFFLSELVVGEDTRIRFPMLSKLTAHVEIRKHRDGANVRSGSKKRKSDSFRARSACPLDKGTYGDCTSKFGPK
jgi:hypothetical protein